MRIADGIALPTAEQIERITPIIESEFKGAGIAIMGIAPHPQGGFIARAVMAREQYHKVDSALFAHGIVIVNLGPASYGFAVRN